MSAMQRFWWWVVWPVLGAIFLNVVLVLQGLSNPNFQTVSHLYDFNTLLVPMALLVTAWRMRARHRRPLDASRWRRWVVVLYMVGGSGCRS